MTMSPSGPIILVVDDDPDFREILSGVLQQNNFQTIEAAGAKELLSFANDSEFDCVLLDYNLEGETAFHVMDVLADSANADAPIIIMTASKEQSVAIKAFRFGVADFLPKTSLGFRDLRTVIEGAIVSKRQSVAERLELERLRAERAIDLVTGTFSRAEFERQVQSLGEADPSRLEPIIVVSFDIYYRETLHRFGQKQADTFLRETIKRLRTHSDADDIWGRTGDGTFACLAPAIRDRARLKTRLDTLREGLSFVFHVGSATLSVEPELSVLIASDDEDSLSDQLAKLSRPSTEPTTRAAAQPFADADESAGGDNAGQVERRRVRRTRVLKAAKILIGPSTIDCVARDMTEHGLRLRLDHYMPLPSKFSVQLTESSEEHPVMLKWQRDRECGVAFI